MIGLQHEMTYRLRVRGPMTPTRGSPRGERIAMPGGDWYSPARMASDVRTSACNSSPTMMR